MVSHEVGAFAVPAFGPVEGVVATAYGYEVAHVYRAAESTLGYDCDCLMECDNNGSNRCV